MLDIRKLSTSLQIIEVNIINIPIKYINLTIVGAVGEPPERRREFDGVRGHREGARSCVRMCRDNFVITQTTRDSPNSTRFCSGRVDSYKDAPPY